MLNFSIEKPHRRVVLTASLLSAYALAWAQPVGTVQQDRQPTWQASQATTSVPPVAYTSVFSDLPKGVERTALDWKAANAKVGQFKRGHADLVKWEQELTEKAGKAADAAPIAKPTPSGERP